MTTISLKDLGNVIGAFGDAASLSLSLYILLEFRVIPVRPNIRASRTAVILDSLIAARIADKSPEVSLGEEFGDGSETPRPSPPLGAPRHQIVLDVHHLVPRIPMWDLLGFDSRILAKVVLLEDQRFFRLRSHCALSRPEPACIRLRSGRPPSPGRSRTSRPVIGSLP